jgi:hypothetical protein
LANRSNTPPVDIDPAVKAQIEADAKAKAEADLAEEKNQLEEEKAKLKAEREAFEVEKVKAEVESAEPSQAIGAGPVERVTFSHRFLAMTYNFGGRQIDFVNGTYTTDDLGIIAALRNHEDMGKELAEVTPE